MPDGPPSPRPPHQDPAAWGALIETLDLSSILVVLNGWLGAGLRQRIQVEDIWQETLWSAWRDRDQHTWTSLSAYRAWLLAIARNRIADAARHLSRDKRGGDQKTTNFSALADGESVSHLLPPRSTTPSRIADHQERAALMQQALDRLSPELRAVVRLRLFEELPMREVATTLDIPLSTAKERFVRGLQTYEQRLQRLLHSQSHGDDGDATPPEPDA